MRLQWSIQQTIGTDLIQVCAAVIVDRTPFIRFPTSLYPAFPTLLLFSLISHLQPSCLALLASRSSPLGMLASRYPGIPKLMPPFLLESVICVGSAIILHLHRLLQFSITHKYCYCYYLYICLYVFL